MKDTTSMLSMGFTKMMWFLNAIWNLILFCKSIKRLKIFVAFIELFKCELLYWIEANIRKYKVLFVS